MPSPRSPAPRSCPRSPASTASPRSTSTGGLEERLAVTLDPDKLAASGVSTQQIVGILQANNLTFPSGQLSGDGTRTPVSTIGRFTSVEEVSNLVVGYTQPVDGRPARSRIGPGRLAGPVGGAGRARADHPGRPRHRRDRRHRHDRLRPDQRQAVAQPDRVEDRGRQHGRRRRGGPGQARRDRRAPRRRADDHDGQRPVTFIIESRDGLVREGGLGALFAILTIFAFLLSVRSTIVAAISIPLSILTALVVMQITGITINIMTLGGLAVAVGRVVDDAIVVLENIYRHRAMGEDRMTASLNGPKEVAGAITASTLTTVAVFLPLGFVGGLVSQFFLPFALTVTFALLASLICALTVVPVLAYLLIDKVKPRQARMASRRLDLGEGLHADDRLRAQEPLDKVGVLAVAAVLFFATTSLAPLLPTQFINAGSEKILASHHRPADRRELRGRPREVGRGGGHPPRRSRGRARADDRPGRGRHQLPGLPVRPERHPRQQRHDDRAPGGGGRPRRVHRPAHRRPRADQDGRL